MVLNWRGRAAKLDRYFNEGRALFDRVRGLIIVAAALKILGLPVWGLVALAPVAIISYVLLGWWWVRHGWYKHGTEVALFDRWTPYDVWKAHMDVRLYRANGVQLNGYDATRIPEEIEHVLASRRRE